jgi:hypothetical protein
MVVTAFFINHLRLSISLPEVLAGRRQKEAWLELTHQTVAIEQNSLERPC